MEATNVTGLYSQLNDGDQRDACIACIEEYRDSENPTGKKGLNKLLDLFYKYNFPRIQKRILKGHSAETLAELILPYAREHKAFTQLRGDAVRAWLLGRKQELLGDFIEGCGLTNEDGFIKESEPPSQTILVKGIKAVREKHIKSDVDIYFDYLLTLNDPFWAALPSALKSAQ